MTKLRPNSTQYILTTMPPLDTTAQALAEAGRLMTSSEHDDDVTCCYPRHHQQYPQEDSNDSSFRKLLVKTRDVSSSSHQDNDLDGRDGMDAIIATPTTATECLLYKNNHHPSIIHHMNHHKKSSILRGVVITTALSLTLLQLWHLPDTLMTSAAGVWMDHTALEQQQQQQQQQQPSVERPSIVLFGDSLTQQGFGTHGTIGWASLLASDYARRADVLNRGFSGYNTNMALQVWPSIQPVLESSAVLFTTVFFGANDAVVPTHSNQSKQHVPLEDYRQNIEAIVDHIMQSAWALQPQARDDPTKKVIFLITPPPVDEEAWAAFRNTSTNRFNHVTHQYAQVVRDIVQERQTQTTGGGAMVALVDAWEILEGHNHTAYAQYLRDGLHLNERGNRKLYTGIMNLIQRGYPWLAPQDGVPLEEKAWYEYDA